jgi:hypothetical protein
MGSALAGQGPPSPNEVSNLASLGGTSRRGARRGFDRHRVRDVASEALEHPPGAGDGRARCRAEAVLRGGHRSAEVSENRTWTRLLIEINPDMRALLLYASGSMLSYR